MPYSALMLITFLAVATLASAIIAFVRFRRNERGYAFAWLACCLINGYCLLRQFLV